MLTAVFAMLLIPAPGPPAGLVLSGGAEVARDGGPSVPAAPGELLYPGDTVTARQPVRLLSCPDNMMGSLPAGVTASVEAGGIKSPHWASRKEIGACFLPLVKKGPVGGAARLGAMMIRSLEIENPGTRESRIQALDPARRETVARRLAQLEGDTPELSVMRGALFQRNRLHLDAKQEYEAALRHWPKASWLKVLIVEADDALLRAR